MIIAHKLQNYVYCFTANCLKFFDENDDLSLFEIDPGFSNIVQVTGHWDEWW